MRRVIYEEAMSGITISRIIRNYEFNMPSKHTHDEYEIYYLIRGERSYFIENRIYHVKAGDLVFINRGTIHMTSQYGDTYHERIVVEFRDDPLASVLACTGEMVLSDFFAKNQGVIALSPENQKYILALLDGIGREMSIRDPGCKIMSMEKLIRLLFFAQRYLQCNEPVTTLSTSATHQKVTEVASYITAHPAEADSLDSVAKRFYMSKSYLSRVFKEFTGYTVNEYINVNRIQQARRLLAETDRSITEIAESLGYDSITYFEKIFRKHTETSPLKYRKQYLREKEKQNPSSRPQSFLGEEL
ncbi:MAG: AraC family transcriptional regulator [Eubacteriales bacterium]|nr:AraC family transcriptional regulator [Eubacteriales bacterium]